MFSLVTSSLPKFRRSCQKLQIPRPSKFPCNANPQHVQHGYSTTIRDPRCRMDLLRHMAIFRLTGGFSHASSSDTPMEFMSTDPCLPGMIRKILRVRSASRRPQSDGNVPTLLKSQENPKTKNPKTT